MNRSLLACVLALGLAGCAGDVDDPLPPAPVPEEQRDPPDRPLYAPNRDPQALLMGAIETERFEGVAPRQTPRWPGPVPEKP
jgi:hypothetical protein